MASQPSMPICAQRGLSSSRSQRIFVGGAPELLTHASESLREGGFMRVFMKGAWAEAHI